MAYYQLIYRTVAEENKGFSSDFKKLKKLRSFFNL